MDYVLSGTARVSLVIIAVMGACAALASLPAAAPVAAAGSDDFVTTWRTGDSAQIIIPISDATGTYTIDWGDGNTTSSDRIVNWRHVYASEGAYTVRISGDLTGIRLADANTANAKKLQSIDQWGTAQWSSMESAFKGASNMVYNAADSPDLSGVSDMSRMFYGASSFNGNLSGWDTSHVTDMSDMFFDAYAFNGNVSDWDTSRVTDMRNMFRGAISFNGNLSGWDTSRVSDMYFMFSRASSFNSDISDWDTSRVTDMTAMFSSARAFNSDISGWDTSHVTGMNFMFSGTRAFNSDISDWDTSSVTNMNYMFSNTRAFNGNLSGWNTSNVAHMHSMFSEASSFNGNLSGWDTSRVTDMGFMFGGASSFNGNLSGWDTSSLRDASYMFARAYAFNSDISGWNTSSMRDMGGMFSSARVFNSDISDWDTSRVKDMGFMFFGTDAFNSDISDWDTSSVTDMSDMFLHATAFNSDISGWDVSSATTMRDMFSGATSFGQNLGPWYVTLDSTRIYNGSYAADIGAQNPFLRGHNPSYSLAAGAGCADNDKFTITDGVLAINSAPTQDTYSICIEASGGSLFGTDNARQVTLSVNSPPAADAGPEQTVLEGTTVHLDGSGSSDPDGDTISYMWVTPADITLQNANTSAPSFTAPNVTTNTGYTLTLTVSDGAATATDTVTITVQDVPASQTSPLQPPADSRNDVPAQQTSSLPPPAAPTNLRASSTTDSVTLTWDDPGDDSITGYKILYRTPPVQKTLEVLINDTGSAANSYTVRDLEPGTKYVFRVIALTDHGESKASKPVSIRTLSGN